jgi:hypothetical protein
MPYLLPRTSISMLFFPLFIYESKFIFSSLHVNVHSTSIRSRVATEGSDKADAGTSFGGGTLKGTGLRL